MVHYPDIGAMFRDARHAYEAELLQEARNVGQPRPGFFKLRLIRRGPWVPARIRRVCHCTVNGGDDGAEHDWQDTCDRFPPLVADINGIEADIYQVWTFGQFLHGQDGLTPAEEYAYQRALLAHNSTDGRARVDLNKTAPVF